MYMGEQICSIYLFLVELLLLGGFLSSALQIGGGQMLNGHASAPSPTMCPCPINEYCEHGCGWTCFDMEVVAFIVRA